MEQIAANISVLCILVFVCGILYQLGCFSATEKVIKFIIAVYIVFFAVKSFANFNPKITLENYTQFYQEQNTQLFKVSLIDETEKNLEEIVKNRLEEKNISYKDISVHILEQNGNLTVDGIYIDCENKDKDAVYKCIEDMLSEHTNVFIGE